MSSCLTATVAPPAALGRMVCGDDTMRNAPTARDAPEARAIDAWVRREFSTRYESALTDPLPSELLTLLNMTR